MDKEKMNEENSENSYICLEESIYCSSPDIGVKSKSKNRNKMNSERYKNNLFQSNNTSNNNFTFSLSKELSTKEKTDDKSNNNSYKKYLTNKKNNKYSTIRKFISQPIIYENNYEDANFISHSIKDGKIYLFKSSNDIKEKDRKKEKYFLKNKNNYKSRKKIRKNTDNIYTNRYNISPERKKIKKKFSLLNNEIKLERIIKKGINLKSSITLKRQFSPKNKIKNRISRINSINAKLSKNVFNNNDNNKFIKKYSSNLALEVYKSNNIKIKFDMIDQDSPREKLILNYENKKETIEILSDTENINNYYEYMEICLQTLQEMNIKEHPKNTNKLKINFPKEIRNKKIALFDLDETLVHCVGEITEKNKNNKEFINTKKIKVLLPNKKEILIGINIRPHWKESLDKIKDIYNIIIFTASHKSYSDAVLNYLDPDNNYFKYRLYRDSCTLYKKNEINFYVKDLNIFKNVFNLKDIIIIDNSILSFAYHLNNGIPVVPFYDSLIDTELPLLSYYLLSIANYNDLRVANQEHIKLEFFLKQTKQIKCQDIESISTKKNNLSLIEFKQEDNNDKKKDGNKSEKKIFNINDFNRAYPEIKRSNTFDAEINKNIYFFEKWKNAYLKLTTKK